MQITKIVKSTVVFSFDQFSVEWLQCHNCDRHGFGSKRTRHFVVFLGKILYETCQVVLAAVLNFSHIFMKLKNQNKNF